MRRTSTLVLPVLLVSLAPVACVRARTAAPVVRVVRAPPPRPGDSAARGRDEIVVCGQRFHTGTKVVLWTDPEGYDAYRPHRRFEPDEALPRDGKEIPRYGSYRRGLPEDLAARVREDGWRLEDLQQVAHQVVVHYDAAGTSARCFEILQDVRGLSCHFLLDADGTIYQTLDLKERAWHAGTANDRSVGIEIANVGAYADREVLDRWYVEDDAGVRLRLPGSVRRGALPEDRVLRPAREGPVAGEIQGRRLLQQDFTPQQYEALAHLLAALSRVLPRCRLEAPRDETGAVVSTVLPESERKAFEGVLGHWHVSAAKVDPGPAFDWDGVLAHARALAAGR